MFERFTHEARRVVTTAAELSGRLGHDYLGSEHLLLATASAGSSSTREVLRASGFDAERARVQLERSVVRCSDAFDDADAAALGAIGIDLEEVRRRTEAAFGPGALDRRRRWHGRRRSRVCGLPVTPKAKKALELALRNAVRLGHRWIGSEHVLLGLLEHDTMSARLLIDQGVDLSALRGDILRRTEAYRERGA